jgi:hyperosmotically inducible protein
LKRLIVLTLLAAAAYGVEPARQRLEKAVRHELVMLPYHGIFDNLAFQIDGRKVILFGEVTRPALKSDAERAVRHIEGVEAVENRLEVLPLSPHDDRIRLAVFRAIYGHTALNRYALQAVPSIHIIVRHGHVVLKGAVATQAEKNIAGIQANGVAGVFSVANDLRLDSE